jgi:hypothetical protein
MRICIGYKDSIGLKVSNNINREKLLYFIKKEYYNMPLSATDIKVANELSRIVKIGSEIIKDISEKKSFSTTKLSRFRVSSENILGMRFGTDSNFYKLFLESCEMEYSSNYSRNLIIVKMTRIQIGILQTALDALTGGLTKDLFYEKEIIVFNDLLDQAYTFLENQNTYLAAGVYGRIVLETTIREFAKLKLRENYKPDMKFDQIIIKLRDGGFILKTFEERLRSYYTIGSDAAHNSEDFKKVSKKELNNFLTFIKDNVLTLN